MIDYYLYYLMAHVLGALVVVLVGVVAVLLDLLWRARRARLAAEAARVEAEARLRRAEDVIASAEFADTLTDDALDALNQAHRDSLTEVAR